MKKKDVKKSEKYETDGRTEDNGSKWNDKEKVVWKWQKYENNVENEKWKKERQWKI